MADDNGALVWPLAIRAPFGMAFEFQGDKKATRHILYNVTASRPGMEGETKGETRAANGDTEPSSSIYTKGCNQTETAKTRV